MGCRNRKTNLGTDGKVYRGGNHSAAHSKHEEGGVVFEGIDLDDLSTDSIGNTVPYTNTENTGEYEANKWKQVINLRSSKLHDRSEDHGLPVLERTRRNRRRPGVGAIIGTDVPGIEEREYCANSKDIIILLKNHLDGWQKAATGWLVLSGRVLEGFWRAAGIKRKFAGLLSLYVPAPIRART